ncbi:Alcohol dehydrogenase, class IV [Amycolatopsis lurida]|uniref:Maleylacetate reductase n=1 Tax=Amycolatopsis lurida NRRL 2430 TaxID=1460371 RepID=A0A2P2FYR3_AMYLU|nr:maleylacetate reductase [Amycolatopsis lurida]KFU81871.1 Maleylacetate reductase [Amycolatopsis lurida NRRL 2430]SEB32347.1 Alcohol dehydrogenase, class IV [Amycolatopsis lurida]
MSAFTYDVLPGRVVFGPGVARTRLRVEADAFDARRILLIAAESEADLARDLCAPFADRIAVTFSEVRPHVPIEVAERAREAAAGADLMLCVGGGSTTGTAKAVALTTGLPIIAVPTTYAGSEVTPVWGLTEKSRKTTGTDPRVLPRTVVYDPELTRTLPVELSVASGLNAMAHCVEAFWAPRRNPVSSAVAEDGIRHLAAGLPSVAADGADSEARGELLLGAYLAGSAFAAAGSGLHHKICHVLGGAFDLPHARTHAIVLPHVLAFNAPYAPEAVSRIASALDSPEPAQGLRRLGEKLGVPAGLRDLGLRENDTETVLDDILALAPADNPRPVTAEGISRLLRAAWAGTDTAKETT